MAAQAATGGSTNRLLLVGNRKGGAIADKEEKLEMEGEVVEALRNRMFRIQLDNGHETLGYTAGRCGATASGSSSATASKSSCRPTT